MLCKSFFQLEARKSCAVVTVVISSPIHLAHFSRPCTITACNSPVLAVEAHVATPLASYQARATTGRPTDATAGIAVATGIVTDTIAAPVADSKSTAAATI